MSKLQTVLDALEQWTDETPRCDLGALDAKIHEAITIVKEMMAQEPVAKVQMHPNGSRRVVFPESIVDMDAQWHTTQELFAAPVAMPAQTRTQIFTTGHCKEKAKPGGCQLHNLQCSYPACDRVLSAAPKGAV